MIRETLKLLECEIEDLIKENKDLIDKVKTQEILLNADEEYVKNYKKNNMRLLKEELAKERERGNKMFEEIGRLVRMNDEVYKKYTFVLTDRDRLRKEVEDLKIHITVLTGVPEMVEPYGRSIVDIVNEKLKKTKKGKRKL